MDVVKLEAGAFAPHDADFIRIDRCFSGNFSLIGSLAAQANMVSLGVFATETLAEEAGHQWADGCGVSRLFLETPNA